MIPKPLLFLALPLLLASRGVAESYRFTTLNPSAPNYSLNWPRAINDRGEILFNGINNATGAADAVFILKKRGRLTRVQFPGAQPAEVQATALSSDDTVGGYMVPANSSGTALFELSDEGILRIMPPVPAGGDATFYGMNNRGDFTTNGINGTANEHPYFFVNGAYSLVHYPGVTTYTASGISNDDTVVGTLLDLQQGYTLRKGLFSLFSVPGAAWTHADCISDNGRYVCGSYSASSNTHCFIRYGRGEFATIDFQPPQTTTGRNGVETLQHFSSAITGVNDRGQVCGLCVARYGNTMATDVVEIWFTGEPHRRP